MAQTVSIFWFRRDLRLNDNAGLQAALRNGNPVLPLFIFDTNILNELEDKDDRRVSFIHKHLFEIKTNLEDKGSSILVKHGKPAEVFREIISNYNIAKVYTNRDYEPYARERDKETEQLLNNNGIDFLSYKDQVIHEKDDVLKDDGSPYTVFTPYMKKWKNAISNQSFQQHPSEKNQDGFLKIEPLPFPSIIELGFENNPAHFPEKRIPFDIIETYDKTRDFPGITGTSRLSAHLRFGTISIREVMKIAADTNETWYNELIWREFYMMILWQYPYVVKKPFRKVYENIVWRNNEEEFDKWCSGKTGYPLVDAGMRQLNETGYMHNRVRMVTASFLTKDLLTDWRWGEAYFANKLLDYELSSNNGGWQWAAGTGVDAAPYFRIFNPESQQKKFDPELHYIRKYIPEYHTDDYPDPIVNHKEARKRTLKTYQEALKR